MPSSELHQQLSSLTAQLAGQNLDGEMQDWLNRQHGAGSERFKALLNACQAGIAEGWLCQQEAGGIRYGRAFKPTEELHGFSVDVVDMKDVVGPHHRHPAA